jgi:hypothetical protein
MLSFVFHFILNIVVYINGERKLGGLSVRVEYRANRCHS